MPIEASKRSPKISGPLSSPSSIPRQPKPLPKNQVGGADPVSAKPSEEEAGEPRHPRATADLFGHAGAEAAFLAAYRGARVPHAFLIVGPKGIGKATLAYRIARFVLAHPDPAASAVQRAKSLAVDAKDPVARRVAAQGQGDLLILERTP